MLRLKNGETQVLAGLILDDERKNASKLPGLGDIPLLGRLFSNQEDKKSKTEIVLAITPRIIGNINLPNAEVSEYWSGTESVITDKPQVSLPSAIAPLSRQDQIKEQAKLRQVRANADATPEPSPATEPVNPQPVESAVGVNAEASGVLPQQSETQGEPPTIDPANPPIAP